jgi:3-oxoadipate enol-lactonase
MGTRTAWLSRDRIRLRYQIEGQGRPTLLIHEMGGALDSWDRVVSALGTGWQVLRYDQRGSGESSPIRGTVNLDDLVEDALAVWDASCLPYPVQLIASALGCATAVRLAARAPERVSQLTLLTPALGVPETRRASVLAVADRIELEGAEKFVSSTLDVAYPVQFRGDRKQFEAFCAIQFANSASSLAAYWRMLADIELRN